MPPSGYDEELAALFRDLRRALDASEDDVATRLDTDVEVIRALEEGALASLPPFAETSRIVIAYTSILGLDARPILRRIHGQLVSRVTGEPPPPPQPQTQNNPPQDFAPRPPQPAGGERRPPAPHPMQELRPGQGRPGPNQPPRPGPGQPPRPGQGQGQGPQRHPQQPQAQQPPRPRAGLEQVRPLRPGHGAPDDANIRGPAPQPRRAPEPPPFRSEPPRDYDEPEFVEDADMGEDDAEPRPARFRGQRRWLSRYGFYAASGLVTLTVVTLLILSPGTVVNTLEGMPPPFPTIAEAVRNVLAPGPGKPAVSEDDPRSRKADKLPVPSE